MSGIGADLPKDQGSWALGPLNPICWVAQAHPQKGRKIASHKKTPILLSKNAFFCVSDLGADLPKDLGPMALGHPKP